MKNSRSNPTAQGRICTAGLMVTLLVASVHSFQVTRPAFLGKLPTSPTLSRPPVVVPTISRNKEHPTLHIRTFPPLCSTANNDSEQESDEEEETVDEANSLYQPQPGERIDSTEPVQVNFDDMFQGMPKMDEILSTDEPTSSVGMEGDYLAAGAPDETMSEQQVKSSSSDKDAWFQPIQKEIERKYAGIREQMVQELKEQRRTDPDSVPDNADLLMETVWQLEMEEEIEAEREKAAKALLEEYESEGLKDTASRDLSGSEDSEVAQKLQQELKEEQEQKAAQQARIDDFLKYEQESAQKAAQKEVAGIDEDGDLDMWALERLEEMLSSTPEEELEVAENLQTNIEELRSKIEKEQKRGTIKPETVKEWQMYRAIATRMLEDEEGDEKPMEDESAIADQLESWKSYQVKERKIRSKSGLSMGPRMPFEWHEAPKSPSRIDANVPPPPVDDKRSRKEIRADVNQKSIEVLEDMLEKALGTPREESLRQTLEDLKAGLEEDLAMEDEEEELIESDKPTGPVDISDVFVRVKETPRVSEPKKIEEPEVVAPPSTPFFSADVEDVDMRDTSSADSTAPQRPSTPFFSDDEDDLDIEPEEIDSSKLGTLEEQKLQRMYRRAGAVTAEEQEKIKAEWEMFQNVEKQKRDISGLSDESSSLSEADLKYDISEVMKDGDIDAEKILSTIGPRPTRKRKRDGGTSATASSSTASTVEVPPGDTTTADSSIAELDSADTKEKDEVDSDEIMDSMFRSVSAVGGGRTKDDPEAKAKEKSAFEDFVQKQAQVRENLDQIDVTLVNKTMDEALEELGFEETETSSENLDDKGYTDELLDSVGARPKREHKLSPAEYERVYSDNGGVSSAKDEDSDTTSDEDELVPPWMRKAKDGDDFRGRPLGPMLEEEEKEHDKKMEQLREYEQRRAPKRPRQMGIDLSDVFGRDIAADNDYEYGETSLGWERGRSFTGFESRKANLLDYTELDVRELNLLMDTKDSVQSTGVSQYIPRINKPFRDFGAIFRMEGVLLDTTGFEYEAWTKTAEAHGYKPPLLEDVKLAAVTRPETAARKIFLWTDDFLMCKEIARTHSGAMKDVFAKWMKEKNIVYVPPEVPATIKQEATVSTSRSTVDVVSSNADSDRQLAAWTQTAEKYGFTPPSLDDVLFASVISADDAVMNSFGWTSDRSMVSDIVTTFQSFLSGGEEQTSKTTATVESEPTTVTSTEPPGSSRTELSENDMLEIQYKAWLEVAKENDLDPPTPDEALGAMVINDPILVVRDGFAWTEDAARIGELVREYEESVRGQVRQFSGDTNVAPTTFDATTAVPDQGNTGEEKQAPSGPTEEEVTEMKAYAWMAAAEKHDCDEPMVDDFRAALYADPEYAVKEVFCWTDDDDKARAVAATYQQEMDEMSKEYIEKYNLNVVPPTNVPTPPKAEKPMGPSTGELFQAASKAWKRVAGRRGYPPPDDYQVQFSMTVGPEDGVKSFKWTEDAAEQKAIVEEYQNEIRQTKQIGGYELGLAPRQPSEKPRNDTPPPYTVIPGASNWLDSLLEVEMPCAVISYLEREQVDVLLDQTGLASYFPVDKRVTESNGYELEGQQMLGAALRLERRPDHCVVFDSSPGSSVAAHDVDMKSVSMIGAYPMYELLNADSTARYLDELTAMNVRRLFGERVYDQPMADALDDRPDVKKQTTTLTRFWEEGDRE